MKSQIAIRIYSFHLWPNRNEKLNIQQRCTNAFKISDNFAFKSGKLQAVLIADSFW